ncbi:MAG: hypothetical protein ACJ75F_08200 [Flavisolibacter sp.]
MKKNQTVNKLLLIPPAGSILFMILYYTATRYYPGGDFENPQTKGFSWKHNFWCHLLTEKSLNGNLNASRPWAISAMMVLAFSAILFMILIPIKLDLPVRNKRIIHLTGTISILVSFLLLSSFHDEAIQAGSAFGIIALTGILAGMYKTGEKLLFIPGVFATLMGMANFIMYYASTGMMYLPVIQKIAFAAFLLWFIVSCLQLRNE